MIADFTITFRHQFTKSDTQGQVCEKAKSEVSRSFEKKRLVVFSNFAINRAGRFRDPPRARCSIPLITLQETHLVKRKILIVRDGIYETA